jgi:hypothetical protein
MQLLFLVIAVAIVVLAISFTGMYYLNRSVDQSDR